MKKQDEIMQYSMYFSKAIDYVLQDEESDYYIDLEEADPTNVFTALVLSCGYIFNRYTNEKKNYLEFTHIANQLVVQYLLNNKESSKE